MNSILRITFIGITFLHILSCRNSLAPPLPQGQRLATNSLLPPVETLLGIVDTEYDGTVLIQLEQGMTLSSFPTGSISGTFYPPGAGNRDRVNIGAITIGDITLESGAQGRYHYGRTRTEFEQLASWYGRNTLLELGEVALGQMYIPQKMVLNAPIWDGIDTAGTLGGDLELSWEPDPNNEQGVYIFFEFDPRAGNNQGFLEFEPVYNYFQVEDQGNFTIAANEFENIPNGAAVELYLVRGNYTVLEAQSKRY
ncbi:MAG: hypothetical protein AAFW73_27090, partial [Bacteroidota bacterium]